MPEMAVCAAGSLLGIHLAQSSFPVGKVDYLKMNPMGFFEFLEGTDQTRYGDYLRRYTGEETIPEVVHKHLWAHPWGLEHAPSEKHYRLRLRHL